jgi:hypothetical protein
VIDSRHQALSVLKNQMRSDRRNKHHFCRIKRFHDVVGL